MSQWRLQSLPYSSSPGKLPDEAANSKPHFHRLKALALLSSSLFLMLYLRKKLLKEDWVLDPQMVIYQEGDILPKSVDWRERGVLCPIKDQLGGGSYVFASVAAIEAIHKIRTGKLVALSEQQVLDCDLRNYGRLECDIGCVFRFVIENGGIFSQREYPYTGRFRRCKKRRRSLISFQPIITINNYGFVVNDELSLKKAVSIQPIVATIIPPVDFDYYNGDICRVPLEVKDYVKLPENESPRPQNVLIVGYRTTSDDEDYWILRNSHGKGWGENGYMRVSCEAAKTWLITLHAVYPIKFGGSRSS